MPTHPPTKIACTFGAILLALQSSALAQTKPQSKPAVPPAPIVDVGTVIGDFARDYDHASNKYMIDDVTLQGKVEKVNIRKSPDGKNTFVTLILVPRESASSTMVPVWVDFPGTMADQVAKLKPGDLVQVETVFSTIPEPPVVHEIRGFIGGKITAMGVDDKLPKLRKELIDWLKKNNALASPADGSDNNLVKDMTKQIDQNLAKGADFQITFGSGLMHSGKTTILCVQDGKMFPVELTAEQAAIVKAGPMGASSLAIPSTSMRMPPELELAPPVIAGGATAWKMNAGLRATAKTKELSDHFFDKPGEYGIRMVCAAGKNQLSFYCSFHGKPGNANWTLEFKPLKWEIAQLGITKDPQPHVVFFEVVRRIGDDRFTPETAAPVYEVISEPQPMVLMLSSE